MKKSKFISLALALALGTSLSVPTLAANSVSGPGSLSTEVDLSVAVHRR